MHSDGVSPGGQARATARVGSLDAFIDESAENSAHLRAEKHARRQADQRRKLYPYRVIPPHVRHCGVWRIALVSTGQVATTPYRCESWRCPDCRRYVAAQLFARVSAAFELLDLADCALAVFTFDGHRELSLDWEATYRRIKGVDQAFMRRFRSWLTVRGMSLGKHWVKTIESHADGVPHVNCLMYVPGLGRYLAEQRAERAEWLACGGTCGDCSGCRALHRAPDDLVPELVDSGYGPVATLESVRSIDAAAAYVTKTAGAFDAVAGEVVKASQLPMHAPVRMRRVRSGKGFLPPKDSRTGAGVGMLCLTSQTSDGSPHVRIAGYGLFAPEKRELAESAVRPLILDYHELRLRGSQVPPVVSFDRVRDQWLSDEPQFRALNERLARARGIDRRRAACAGLRPPVAVTVPSPAKLAMVQLSLLSRWASHL
jgi:hypothetical protein